jgi:hypothetical protein
MARYIGAAVAVAAIAAISDSATANSAASGAAPPEALAHGLAIASITMAIWAGAGVLLILLLRGQAPIQTKAVDRAAAAAITTHTIPTEPVSVA